VREGAALLFIPIVSVVINGARRTAHCNRNKLAAEVCSMISSKGIFVAHITQKVLNLLSALNTIKPSSMASGLHRPLLQLCESQKHMIEKPPIRRPTTE
jgi:hypothetical protein